MRDKRPITNVVVTGITPKGRRALELRGWRSVWHWWWFGLYRHPILCHLPQRFRHHMADLVL